MSLQGSVKYMLVLFVSGITFCFIVVIALVPILNKWPMTLNQACNTVIEGLTTDELVKLKNTKKEDLVKYHLSLGMGIRNNFGLWRGNLVLLLNTREMHPDAASRVIILKTWEKLNNEEDDIIQKD